MDTDTSGLTNEYRSWISEDKDWIKVDTNNDVDHVNFMLKLTIDEMIRTIAEMGYLMGDEGLMVPFRFFKSLKTEIRDNHPDLDVDHITLGELVNLNLLEFNEGV